MDRKHFFLSVILLSSSFHHGNSHVSISFPPPRTYGLDFLDNVRTKGPCGMPRGLNPPFPLLGGIKYNFTWHSAYPHRGGYRLELLDPDYKLIQILAPAPNSPSVWANPDDPTRTHHEVELPRRECENCVVRLIRQAAEWSAGKNLYLFRSCSDVSLQSRVTKREMCSYHGTYNLPLRSCLCDKLYGGELCEVKDECATDRDCNFNGRCLHTEPHEYPQRQCYCSAGFFGDKCQYRSNLPLPDEIDESLYSEKVANNDVRVLYRVLEKSNEVEVMVEANTESWVGLGFKSTSTDSLCKKFPRVPTEKYDSKIPIFYEDGEKLRDVRFLRLPEASAESEPHSEGEPKHYAEGEHEPESEGESEPHSEGESEPHSEGEYKHHSEPESEGESEHYAEGESEPHSEAEGIKWSSNAEPEADAVSEHYAEGESEPEGEAEGVKWKTNAEYDAEAEGEAYAEGESEPHSEGESEPHSESESEPHSEGEYEPKSEGESEPHAEGESEPEHDAVGESEPHAESESEPHADAESSAKKPAKKGTKIHPMDCSDMVLGSARGMLGRVRDMYTRDRSTPQTDEWYGGRQSLTSAMAFERNGKTTIMFRRKFDTADPADAIIENDDMSVIWAHGQTPGKPVHRPLSGLETAANVSVPDFYRNDELKYHGFGRLNRGKLRINFFDKPRKALVESSVPTGRNHEDFSGVCDGEYKVPRSCSNIDCDYRVTWKYLAGEKALRISIYQNDPEVWSGIGFSLNDEMSQSDIITGWITDQGTVSLQDRFAQGRYEPDIDNRYDERNEIGRVEESGGYTIEFTRPLTTGDVDDFDLTNPECFYMLYPVSGGSIDDRASDIIGYHFSTPDVSAEKFCFNQCHIG